MPCLVASIAFFFPRIAIVLLVIFSDYIGRAFTTTLWPLLGFLLMPYTTLAYAFAKNYHGGIDGLYLGLVILAALFDLGVLGGGGHSATQARKSTVRVTRVR